MQMQGHIPARHFANAGASANPKLCKCRGIFQPEVMQMQGHIPARSYANAAGICQSNAGHIPARHYANARPCVSPELCKCRGTCQADINGNWNGIFQLYMSWPGGCTGTMLRRVLGFALPNPRHRNHLNQSTDQQWLFDSAVCIISSSAN